jgi:hypothetical protein
LLRCQQVARTDEPHARAVFESAFREYGLPEAMRTDNGPPFATRAVAGLSRLSIWWTRLGIRHERIQPGNPQQNGRHERMHQTLKQETASPAQPDLRKQQQRFQQFQKEYNQIRPHEGLQYRTPSELYIAAARQYPDKLPEMGYPAGMHVRRISLGGQLSWKHQEVFISEVLRREIVGLSEIEENLFEVHFGPLLLGWLDSAGLCFVAAQPLAWHVEAFEGLH